MLSTHHSRPGTVHRYRSLYTPLDRAVITALAGAWLAASAAFWWWWFAASHRLSLAGLALTTTLVLTTWIGPTWLLVGVVRAVRPSARLATELRVAMVITRAPSEPFALVRRGLEAMLAQAYPEPYDVWLADEDPTPEIRGWCASHGVRVSCRKGVLGYNQPTWPRRAACKEGNLAYFYDMWGYEHYDVVCQFDADHVPRPTYLRSVMAAFVDRSVGYVAAPSICDANAAGSWAARARVNAEAVLHGAVQAGRTRGVSPVCFGSHYAIRTEALRRVGGLGPELAEDFTTTLAMNAAGYRGAFALDAIAHGDGPDGIADAVVQEMQWARSMTRVYLEWAPQQWPHLSRAQRVNLGFNAVWYPLVAVQMVAAHALVLGALLTRQAWVNVPVADFVVHRSLPVMAMAALVGYLRRRGCLRPVDAKVASWESALLSFARWPWVALGVLQAVAGFLTHRDVSWRVTPKRHDGATPLPARILAPHLTLAVVLVAAAAWGLQEPAARGYAVLALGLAVASAAAVAVIVRLHHRENPRVARRSTLGLRLAAVAVAASAGSVAVRWGDLLFAHVDRLTLPREPSVPSTVPAAGHLAPLTSQPAFLAFVAGLPLLVLWLRVMRPPQARQAPARSEAGGPTRIDEPIIDLRDRAVETRDRADRRTGAAAR